jgi:hypothetical protein
MLAPAASERSAVVAEQKAWQDVLDTPARKRAETCGLLADVRTGCARPADRIDAAEKLKAEANQSFGTGQSGLALRSYLAALWLLRLDDPPLPQVLSEPTTPSGAALLRALDEKAPTAAAATADTAAAVASPLPPAPLPAKAGTSADTETDVDGSTDASPSASSSAAEPAAAAALRTALHLNVAAAALKLGEWPAARHACEYVLSREPQQAKALFRLARAHEGEGELGAAIGVLSGRLLKAEPGNKEAARLAAALKARLEQERRMFGGLFKRAQGDGSDDGGLYSTNALAEEARKRKEEKDRLLKLENLAKLPTDMWAKTFGELEPEQLQGMVAENKELASQMPDTAWQKHMANMSPEALQTARDAVKLHKAREQLKKEGVDVPPLEELEGEVHETGKVRTGDTDGWGDGDVDVDEESPWEAWLDRMITRCGIAIAVLIAVVAAVLSLRSGAVSLDVTG